MPSGAEGRGAGVVLIGLRRAGKTTVGELLAAELGRPFIDLDRAVADASGREPADLLTREGEEALRDWEVRVLRRLVERSPGGVLAAGGGTPTARGASALLETYGTVVYLSVPPDVLLARARADATPSTRPPLRSRSAALEVGRLHAERDASYRVLADLVVDASGGIKKTLGRCRSALIGR